MKDQLKLIEFILTKLKLFSQNSGCWLLISSIYLASIKFIKFNSPLEQYVNITFFIILITSTVFFIKTLLSSLLPLIKVNVYSKPYLKKLNPSEKSLLTQFINSDEKTFVVGKSNKTIPSLIRNKIVSEETFAKNSLERNINYRLENWADAYLKKHPHLLEN
mgnify:CR=1 FL=1